MTAPALYTWDFILPGTFAKAASLDDLGGAQLEDDAVYPPVPPKMPYADQLNQWAKQLAGMNRVITALDIEVTTTPSVVSATAMSDQITTTFAQNSSNFQVEYFATGILTIGWAAGILPPPRTRARAFITDPNPYAAPVVEVLSPNSVTVYTWNLSGTPVNVPLLVSIY